MAKRRKLSGTQYFIPTTSRKVAMKEVAKKISKFNIIEYLKAGHEIYTGAVVSMPMTDKNYLFKSGQGKYGHAFRLIGMEKGLILCETTWKNYGMRKSSQFYMDPKGIENLFSCYVMDFKLG